MTASATHLDYYKQHGINPVHYDTSDLTHHFERRGSLYRTLGITPLAIRGAKVLEVAPGTGQNSLYLARQQPSSLTLVEPNPLAQQDIKTVYAQCDKSIQPELICSRLEDFEPRTTFDLVVCENWLGNSEHERRLLRKLGRYVADGGLMVITTVSPVGMLPNMLRRALSNRLINPDELFSKKTSTLVQAFSPHLQSLSAMTRNATDWIHDNMLNPAYLGVLLTVPMAFAELDSSFDVLGSSPQFGTDWRWFKRLHGDYREFNRHMLNEYNTGLHNFLDQRTTLPPRDVEKNKQLESEAMALATAIIDWELGRSDASNVVCATNRILHSIGDLPTAYSTALVEFLDVFNGTIVTPEQVAALPQLSQLFGRETIYLSFEKRG